MRASIVILNWNGGADSCLESVRSALMQDWPDKEIIFVDNGSTDGSLEAVRSAYGDIAIVALTENIGCPAGRNRGFEHINGDIVFFLENDGAWIENDVVAEAMRLFERDPLLGAIYTRVEGYSTRKIDKPLDGYPGESLAGLYLSSSFRGGASAVRSKSFKDLGGFPDDFLRQMEEGFLSLLIYEAGYKVAYWPSRVMLHKGSDYPGKSTAVSRYRLENEMKTVIRLYPISYAIRLIAVKWSFYLLIFLRQRRLGEFIQITRVLLAERHRKTRYHRISEKTIYLSESLKIASVRINLEEHAIDVKTLVDTVPPVSPILEAFKRLIKR